MWHRLQKAPYKPKLQIESVCECWEHEHRQNYACTEAHTDEEDDEEDDDDNERRRKSGDQLELKAFYQCNCICKLELYIL